MTYAANRLEEAPLTKAALSTAFNPARPLAVPGSFRRAGALVGELSAAVGIAFCVPLVILGIGIPIALCLRLLLWMGGLL